MMTGGPKGKMGFSSSFELQMFSLFSMLCCRPKNFFTVCWILNRVWQCALHKITLWQCAVDKFSIKKKARIKVGQAWQKDKRSEAWLTEPAANLLSQNV